MKASNEWPPLPPDSRILYEHDDPACPQRIVIARHRDKGYEIFIINKWPSSRTAPYLSRQRVLEIANDMIEFVERS